MNLYYTIQSIQEQYLATIDDSETGYEVASKAFPNYDAAEKWSQKTIAKTDPKKWAKTVTELDRLNGEP